MPVNALPDPRGALANVTAALDADELFIFVFAGIAIILVTARALGWLFVRVGQPAVVGEVVGGIVLGPSLLGLLPGQLDQELFPEEARPFLRIVAQLGLVIYMFIVGLELDTRVLAKNRAAAVSISLSSIGLAFVLGIAAGFALYGSHDTATNVAGDVVPVDRLSFALFCGLSISGSAFAILARILDERRLFRTRMGPVLMGCAVVDDIAVWAVAAVVLAVSASRAVDTGADGGNADIIVTLGGLVLFVVVLFFVLRPLYARLIARWRDEDRGLSPDLLAAILVGLLASACVTTWLGISPILGSFLFGAALPRQSTEVIFQQATERLESLSVLVLLPVFFVVTGLGVDLSKLGWEGLATLVLFVVIATGGKMAGAAAAARVQGFRGRRAFAVGCLMNTRGLTELAILSLGRASGVLDTTMFTVLVTTAITTTMVSGPLLRLIYPTALIQQDIDDEDRARLAATDAYRVLLLVDDPDTAGPAVDLAAALAASEPGGELVLSRIAERHDGGELGSGFMGNLAELTGGLDRLRELSRLAEARGVRAVPLSQFSDDVAQDLLAQVGRARPNIVVLVDRGDATTSLAERVVAEARVDAAVVAQGATTGGVVLAAGNEPHQTLAAELALRLARGLGVVMHLDDNRRVQALRATLVALGALVADDPAPADATVVVPAGSGGVDIAGGNASGIVAHATIPTTGRRTLDPLAARLVVPSVGS
jgi:Kef-type K+ transport system membrane component KefB